MAAGLIIVPNYMPALDGNGYPVPGARMWFYLNGTTTPLAVYSDIGLTTAHTNPVVANASGVFAAIYADSANIYTVAVTTSAGVPLVSYGDITPTPSIQSNNLDYYVLAADGGDHGLAITRAFAAGVQNLTVSPRTTARAITTAVTIPANCSIEGLSPSGHTAQVQFTTSASIHMFTAGGSNICFKNINLIHTGATGNVIRGLQYDTIVLDGCTINGSHATNPDDIINFAASYCQTLDTDVYNGRPNLGCWTIKFDRRADVINIGSGVFGGIFGGPGQLFWIGSSDSSHRPEGITLEGYTSNNTNTGVYVEQVLLLIIDNVDMDSGGLKQISFNPLGENIEAVIIGDSWISADHAPAGAARTAIGHDISGGGAIVGLNITNCQINNASAGTDDYGITLYSGAEDVVISNVHIQSTGRAITVAGAKNVLIDGVTTRAIGDKSLNLADGVAGGPIVLGINSWDPASVVDVAQTDPTKFVFGLGNVGKRLANTASAVTGASPASGSSLNIPHGMVAAPNLAKTTVSASPATGSYEQLTAVVTAVDATNIAVRIDYKTELAAGTIRVNAQTSI